MKLTRSTYPDIPGVKGSPCWTLKARWLWADADWNTRFPFGVCLCVRIGPREAEPDHKPECETDCRCEWPKRRNTPSLSLDLNAPLEEPNRLSLHGPKRNYMIGLLSWHREVETGTRQQVIMGREQTVHLTKTVRCWPRPVRGQAWDWKRCEGTMPPRWRWIVAQPNDYRERWERAHPEEAARLRERRRDREAGLR